MRFIFCRIAAFSLVAFAFAFCAVADEQSQSPRDTRVMLLAMSRYESMFAGGIGPSKLTRAGTVAAEPMAYITGAGEWSPLPCASGTGKGCRKFEREYLSKPHFYTVISAGGKGASVHTARSTLSECYGYQGAGTYTQGSVRGSAIAASSTEFFADSVSPRLLGREEAASVRKALAALNPKKLDSAEQLRIFSVQLEGQNLKVVQRAFADAKPEGQLRLVFLLGTVNKGQFHVLNEKHDDEDERVLETIRLKNGREFLVTVVSDPESQFFRVYGIRNGKVGLIYSGGGSSC
jgi:hypothetical protein